MTQKRPLVSQIPRAGKIAASTQIESMAFCDLANGMSGRAAKTRRPKCERRLSQFSAWRCSQRRQSKWPLQRDIIMPARQAANRLRSMNSSAIPTMNNCAIPTPTPFAAFFPVRASEKHEQAKTTLLVTTAAARVSVRVSYSLMSRANALAASLSQSSAIQSIVCLAALSLICIANARDSSARWRQ